jgi:protein archease
MTSRGHCTLPHTADLRIQAWAPTRGECIAEAVAGLVESFADTSGVSAQWSVESELTAAGDEAALVAALDEVIYVLDTQGGVPVGVEVEPIDDDRWWLRLELAPVEAVSLGGAGPKAVALHGLRFGPEGGSWSCEVTVDV